MPRTTERVETTEVHSVVSSAALMPRMDKVRNYKKPETWQDDAWGYYDITGELRYGVGWFSNALSRAVLGVGQRKPGGVIESVTSGPVYDEAQALLGGPAGQAALLKAMGQHYFVAGEWYLVGRAADSQDPESFSEDIWDVVGTQEIKKNGEKWYIDYGDGEKIELADTDAIIRVWNPHPRRRAYPDSPVRAVLGTLEEIRALTDHVRAQVNSRLAGAGVLLMPQEMTFKTEPDEQRPEGVDEFQWTLAKAMAASLRDRTTPEALVPIMARVPAEHLDKIKHLTFWSELDAQAHTQRDASIRRLALGLDMPPEVLLGTSDVNHWGAWQIEESTIKAHIEPALGVIAQALTTSFLWPLVKDKSYVITFDTSALRLRPNRSKEAIELYDRGEINAEALRRETGFNEGDAMEQDERREWFLRKVASGSATPEQVGAALRALGVLEDMPLGDSTSTREARPAPSLVDHPTREMPQPEHAALMAACDALVFRTLERVGNRLGNTRQMKVDGIPADERYLFVQCNNGEVNRLMEGAWSVLPKMLANHVDYRADVVQDALDGYVRTLITGQQPHDQAAMMRVVDRAIEASR